MTHADRLKEIKNDYENGIITDEGHVWLINRVKRLTACLEDAPIILLGETLGSFQLRYSKWYRTNKDRWEE